MTSVAPGGTNPTGHGLRRSASFSCNSSCRKAGLSPYSKMHAVDELEEGLRPDSNQPALAESGSYSSKLDEVSKPGQAQLCWHSRLPIFPKWAQLLGCILLALLLLAILANQLVALQGHWLRGMASDYTGALLQYQQPGSSIGERLYQLKLIFMQRHIRVLPWLSFAMMIPDWMPK